VGPARTITSTVVVTVRPAGGAAAPDRPDAPAGHDGRVLAHEPGRTALMFDSVTAAVAGAVRAARGGGAVGVAVGEMRGTGDAWDGPARELAGALAERARTTGDGTVLATAPVAALTPAPGPGLPPDARWVPSAAIARPGEPGSPPEPTAAEATVDVVELVGIGIGIGIGAAVPAPDAGARRTDPDDLARPTGPNGLNGPNGAVEVPLPVVLALDSGFPFVRREDAWPRLAEAWAAVSAPGAAGRRVVLVGGEAGSGKTRLVTELARQVHDDGGAVLYGACSEQSTLPYEPFSLAVDQLVATVDAPTRAWLLEGRAGELARLVPRLGAGSPAGSTTGEAPVDLGAERFRLFDAVTTLLATLASRRPVLLVLDDLHWARRPTVELLDHLLRSPGTAALYVVATYRSTAADIGEDLKTALPDLRRHPGVSRLVIGGFDRTGVERFVAGAAGHDPGPGLAPVVDLLAEQTGGNAFLLGELWRHLVDTGHVARAAGRWRVSRPVADVASPEGVREVVAARLDRLPGETCELLHRAAVIGTRFPIAVLAAAAGTDVGTVLDRLDPAVRSHLVEEEGTGAHRFVHALVRLAVVGGLSAGERRAHHRDVAQALARVDGDRAVADVAFHTLAAVPLVEAERAVAAGRRAAAAARHAVAYDDAARLLDAVLAMVPSGAPRGELLLELADARMRAGDVAAARQRCVEATELARALDAPDLQVRAALAYDDANWRAALDGTVAAELLRDALPLATAPDRQIQVRATLGRALALSGHGTEAMAMAGTTVAAARELGDPFTLQVAYASALFSPWTPANLDELRRYARELVEVGRSEGNLEWELGGVDKLLFAVIVAGDLDEARAVAARHRALAARVGQPLFRVLDLQAHALLAMGEGRFADAEALAEQADELAGFLSGNNVAGGYGVQLFSIRRDQGRLDEARPLVEAVARFDQAGATWRPALAVLYAELGLVEAAAGELSFLVADDLAAVPRDSLWWASLSYLADAAVALGDRAAAELVYLSLVPARGLVVQVGNLLAAYGAVDRYLGALAALLDRPRDAEAHFENALRLDRRSGMTAWLARTQVAYAAFLLDRHGRHDRVAGRTGTGQGPGSAAREVADVDRALAMLRAAHETAERCGMAHLAARVVPLRERATAARTRAGGAGAAGGPAGGRSRSGTGLTPRELALLPLLAEGCTNREIGARLHISQHTAANHIRSILLKTGCANRTEVAAWALRHGLVGG
jgi:DNA-binding CsgD family transcriptional regulator/tetratricopeptide (TPR) repeat protein